MGRPDLLTPLLIRRLARVSGANVVTTWMSRAGHQVPRGPYLKVCRVGGYYRLENFPHADYFVCNAPDLVRHMVDQGADAARVRLIPNFTPAAQRAPAAPPALGLREGTGVLVILARLHAVKGYDIALRALASVPDAMLLALGEGEERVPLERLAGSLGLTDRVRFLGWQADPGPILRAADACLMPSRREGFGNVILEAWAHGVPMIASDVSGPAWLIESGESGLLVPPDDPEALAGAIHSVLDDPALAQRLREGGRRKLDRDFSEAAIVGQWQTFFAEILAASRP